MIIVSILCAGFGLLSFVLPSVEDSSAVAPVDVPEKVFRSTVRTHELPTVLDLPTGYDEPSLIGALQRSAFAAPSPLVKMWLRLTKEEKRETLQLLGWEADSRWLFAFLGEIAYVGIVLESEPDIAQLIVAAVRSTGSDFPATAIFLLDHIERVCPHESVRSLARHDAESLRRRLRSIGR